MEREIKFRYSWKGNWHYIDFYRNNISLAFNDYESRNKTTRFEQYTGLKDKNGKEIYEGDILARLYNVPWTVKYTDKGYRAFPNIDSGLYFDCNDFKDCEVIGNIHENPDYITTQSVGL